MLLKVCLIVLFALVISPASPHAADRETVAVIGTGDMGNSLGPKLAEIGYQVIYGSRSPSRSYVEDLIARTGPGTQAATQKEAAQAASIVLLAVPWPAMEQVAQNLGNLDGKIVIDVSFPFEQGPDGYPQSTVETSSAELIQSWNPGANVVKWSLPTAYYIDEPLALGQRQLNLIAADDRESKEEVARIAAAIGQVPFDAGPLRMSRAVEAQVLLFMIPLYQRRTEHWENTASLSSYWSCFWQDDWSEPVFDAEDLAEFPRPKSQPTPCSEFPPDR
ncbi:MAG: NAD(P)-binding domain-containing protein [Gammaproteobacteria bacterium]|nr:NAD(P)-binding domain-containing protein [Gammaproteobacteria bacterium]